MSATKYRDNLHNVLVLYYQVAKTDHISEKLNKQLAKDLQNIVEAAVKVEKKEQARKV